MLRLWSRRPAASPRFFTSDWFSHNIPVWEELFAGMKGRAGLTGLEIGSLEGRSAIWLLENVLTGAGARLVCVDVFDRALDPLPGAPAGHYERFAANVAPWRDRVTAHIGESRIVVRRLDQGFDFVYIDGNHRAAYALSDAVFSWWLLRPGGLLIFDDYEWTAVPEPHHRPKMAVDAFMNCFEGHYEVAHRGYQVALRKNEA